MAKHISRPGVRAGYDRWAKTYDDSPNPLVALDRRYTFELLRPLRGERILDAGCGTGAYLRRMTHAGSRPFGIDFSRGMLRVARRANPCTPLVQANLDAELPLVPTTFDAVLCSLVSEHLTRLQLLFSETHAALRPGGRLVLSAFHPEPAASGIEANFESNGTEYRLGAVRYSVDDYLNWVHEAGFRDLRWHEYHGDVRLAREIPGASKYVGCPLLLTVEAQRPPEAH